MRSLALALASLAVLGVATVTTLVHAEEAPKAPPAACLPQKAIQSPLLEALTGRWTTESISMLEGKESKGTGTATFTLGAGRTVLLEDYENTSPGPDGKPMTFHGHGVFKVAEDGKSAKVWWFDDMSPEPTVLAGPLTEKDLTLSAETPMGTMTVSFQRTDAGIAFKMTMPGHEMRETYTRAGSR